MCSNNVTNLEYLWEHNREKVYDIISNASIGLNKEKLQFQKCSTLQCRKCSFYTSDFRCKEKRLEWLKSPKDSKYKCGDVVVIEHNNTQYLREVEYSTSGYILVKSPSHLRPEIYEETEVVSVMGNVHDLD